MRRLAELGLALTGDPLAVFQRIASLLAELLEVPVVNLSQVRGDELFFLASYIRGETTPYAGVCRLADTPCGTVQASRELQVHHDVLRKFPHAEFLKQVNAYTYCGFPALDGAGNVAAVICVLDDRRREFSGDDRDLLRILAQRVGLELERQKHLAEQARKDAELRRALERARDERSKSDAILAAIGDMISIQDRDYRVLYQNEATRGRFGSCVGDLCHEVYERNAAPCPSCPVERVFRDGRVHTSLRTIAAPEGAVYLETTASPLRDRDGAIVAVVEVVRDVTRRRRAEETLEAHLLLMQTVIDAIPAPVFYRDRQGAYLGCNKAFEAVVGLDRGRIIGRTVFDILPRSLADIYYEADMELQQLGGQQSYESSVVYADGSAHTILFSQAPFRGSGGAAAGTVGVMLDITDRKQLEQQLFHSQKMEAVGQLAGGLAHDFNNILTAVIGYGTILLKGMAREDPLRRHAGAILESADRAASLTKSLLSFSRKQIMRARPVALNDIVRRAEGFIGRIIGEDIAIRTVLTDAGTTVLADAGQLEQVLMNLATNARDVMAAGGRLVIETDIVDLDGAFCERHPYVTPGPHVLLAVSDSGAGMDETTRARIFEPFFTTKAEGRGTGLGLSIVYGIVKQHRGYVHAYSEPGIGTTFKIYLPLAGEPAEAERPSEPVEPAGGIETVLLAEDDRMVRELTANVLRTFGYRVIEAADGQDAVQRFRDDGRDVALVITDLVMPRKNGRQAVAEIRALRPEVKVLFLSGYTAETLKGRMDLPENDAFLLKPHAPELLLATVRSLLDGHSGSARPH